VTRRALVTGGSGFVGQWLTRALLTRGWEVYAAGVSQPAPGILDADEERAVHSHRMDIRSAADVAAALDAARPDAIVHLAGVSFLPSASDAPALAWEINVVGAVTLLADVARRRQAGTLDPRILVVGSAQQYGRHDPGELPLAESAEQRPLTVYAASKLAQEVAAFQAFRAEGVQVVATRSFNHSGVGHGAQFLLPALVQRVLALKAGDGAGAGRKAAVPIGNGDVIRDYLHVSDVVEAYLALMEQGIPGEAYNVCSGVGVRVRDLATRVLELAGVRAEISSDAALQRPVDVPALVGSAEKLIRATGWRPRRSTDDIINDLLRATTH
jgi:GDP-4-dehydro-6-deoxy-D-mannose reductase